MRSGKWRMPAALLLFVVAYVSLNLLPREFGREFSTAVCDVAAGLVGGSAFDSDLLLQVTPAFPGKAVAELDNDMAWTGVLSGTRVSKRAHAAVGINLRKSLWVPFAAFAALALASSLWYGVRSLFVLIAGGMILQIPLTLAMVMHVCAVLYEKYVIELSPTAQAAVRFSHAVLEPPGMVYAMPLALWAALTFIARQPQPRATGS